MAEWVEFDLDAAEWRIPVERMKAGVMHVVPLSRSAFDSPRALSGQLRRAASFLRKVRIAIDFERDGRARTRIIRLALFGLILATIPVIVVYLK